ARLAFTAHHRRRSSLHGQMVGAGLADRLRTQLRASGGRLPRRRVQTQTRQPNLPRRAGNAIRVRCRAEIGEDGEVGESEGLKRVTRLHSYMVTSGALDAVPM